MTVSPRKRVSIVGTRSLRTGKVTVNEADWESGNSFQFKASPEISSKGSAIKKKVSPKLKTRRASVVLKRLEVQDGGSKLSPIMSRRTRRTSMITVSTQVKETTKMSRSTSDKVLPASRKTRSKPSNKATATKALPPKAPASKTSAIKSPGKSASPMTPKEKSPKIVSTRTTAKSASATKTTKAVAKTEKKSASPAVAKVKTPPKVQVRKTSGRKPIKSASPASPKETSPKNVKKNEVSAKATVKSSKAKKVTKTVLKTEETLASPKEIMSPPKEVTFSPIKFYSSPKKSATPLKRKSLVIGVDQDVSFNYSPVANKKRKFDGTPTPEKESETNSKRRKIDVSSKKSKLPRLEKKDKASKDTPKSSKSTKSPKVTRSKVIVKSPKEESPAKSSKKAPKSAKKTVVVLSEADVKSPEIQKPTPKALDKKTPDTKIPAPKSSQKKSTMKKTPENSKSIKSSTKKPTPSPKTIQKKKLSSTTKSTKKVKISATSPVESLIQYRKTPKSEKQKKTVAVSDVGASPDLKPAVDLLANIRASPVKSKSKLKPFTPKPDPTPSRVLKQTMKKKAAKNLHAFKVAKKIETSSLVDSELVVMKTPVQLTRTPLRKTSLVTPETPSSASNLPPTPTSSRKTLSVRRTNSVAKRELLNNRPSPPRSSTPIEGDSSPEPQIADPDVTDIEENVLIKEISAQVTTTETVTAEVTISSNGSVEGDDNGVAMTIISEDVSNSSADLNGSALSDTSTQEIDSPPKSRWRYCSVM